MNLQTIHNTDCLPWPHLFKKNGGYQAPPVIVGSGPEPQAVSTEDGKIILDENGNAILT
jgi:hypothetical protein